MRIQHNELIIRQLLRIHYSGFSHFLTLHPFGTESRKSRKCIVICSISVYNSKSAKCRKATEVDNSKEPVI
jgi:hypothetical protein